MPTEPPAHSPERKEGQVLGGRSTRPPVCEGIPHSSTLPASQLVNGAGVAPSSLHSWCVAPNRTCCVSGIVLGMGHSDLDLVLAPGGPVSVRALVELYNGFTELQECKKNLKERKLWLCFERLAQAI